MTSAHRADAQTRAAIEDLVVEHAWVLDHGDPRRLPDLYTDSGQLLGLGEPLVGRAALAGWAEQRALLSGRVSRHVHTNVRLTVDDSGTVHGDVVTLLYRHDGEGSGPTWPFLVLDYTDIYARQDDGSFLFASRSITRVFVDGTRVGAK